MPEYPAPLDRLLKRGDSAFHEEWPNYVAEDGLAPEHVPDLIRMVGDRELQDGEDETASWASIHARRALGQLRAVDAVLPMLGAMDESRDYDDFWLEELPTILAMMGPEAIAPIARRLGERRPDEYTRIACSGALEKIGKTYPEARDECVAILTAHLARKEDDKDSWSLNGFVASDLVELKAVESAAVIEAGFAADVIDESIAGGWETTRFRLGLGPEPKRDPIRPQWRLGFAPPPPQRPNLDKLRRKQKAQKQARKRSRKGR